MRTAACTPVDSAPRVLDPGSATDPARTVVLIEEAETVLAGHYPGFPILPGVCVVEYVHHSALATAPDQDGDSAPRWRLAAVESARFASPVFPGDRLTTELTWSRADGGWHCRAVTSTARGRAATIRLRFEAREAGAA